MGRFYQTAKREFVDNFIYQPPVELMAKVIGNADKQVLDTETEALAIYDKLKAQGLKADEPRLQEIIQGYQSQIEDLSGVMQKSPLEFRKEIGKIRNLSRTIGNDWSSQGEVGKIQEQYAARNAYAKELQDGVEKGKILQENATQALQKFDNEYQGVNYKSASEYNRYNSENLNEYVDADKIADEIGEGWKADVKSKGYDYADGQWVRTVNGKREVADETEIQDSIQRTLLKNEKVRAYYDQQQRLGFMSPEQFAQKIGNTASVYSKKHGYVKQEDETRMKENSNYWAELSWNKAIQEEEMLKALETNKETGEIYGNSVAQDMAEEEWLTKLGSGVTNSISGKPYKFNDVSHAIDILQKSYDKKPSPALLAKLNEAKGIKAKTLSMSKATWAPLYEKGFSVAAVDKLKEKVDEDFLANGLSYKYRLPKLQIMDVNNKLYNSKLKDDYQEFTPKNLVNKKMILPSGQQVTITNVRLVPKSIKPILINGIVNNKSINNNDAHSTLQFVYMDGEEEKTFNQTAFYNMQQSQGFAFD